jgi:hypothetical protein
MTGALATRLRQQRPRKPRRISYNEHFVESDSPATLFLATSECGKRRTRQAPGFINPYASAYTGFGGFDYEASE